MEKSLKLSIIIPVYNVEAYIEKCYNSVKGNYDELQFEIIFVNDGSTDNSLNVLTNLVTPSEYITIISQENLGLSGARNTGIAAARGAYIVFLDSDDWLNFDVIQELLNYAINNELDLVSYGLEFFDEKSQSMGCREKHPIEYSKMLTGRQALIQGFQPSSSCLFLYKSKFLKINNFQFYPRIAQQDVEFTLRIMLLAERVYFSESIGYNYYRHSGTISMPQSVQKLQKYLSDAITVAGLMKNNESAIDKNDIELIRAVQKNYNSVVWNLLWRFLTKPKEVSYAFKKQCIEDMELKDLYPIKGRLKSKFQYLVNFLFKAEYVFLYILKIKESNK